MTLDEVMEQMRRDREEAGTMTELARVYSERLTEKAGKPARISVQYLSDVFNGRRHPAGKILAAMGLTAVVDYRPKATDQ